MLHWHPALTAWELVLQDLSTVTSCTCICLAGHAVCKQPTGREMFNCCNAGFSLSAIEEMMAENKCLMATNTHSSPLAQGPHHCMPCVPASLRCHMHGMLCRPCAPTDADSCWRQSSLR